MNRIFQMVSYGPLKIVLKYSKWYIQRTTLAGYKIVDHSDVGGASPVGATPTTSSFST